MGLDDKLGGSCPHPGNCALNSELLEQLLGDMFMVDSRNTAGGKWAENGITREDFTPAAIDVKIPEILRREGSGLNRVQGRGGGRGC